MDSRHEPGSVLAERHTANPPQKLSPNGIDGELEVAAKALEVLHQAIAELEQRAQPFCVPSPTPAPMAGPASKDGCSSLRSALIDINDSLADAAGRIRNVSKRIDS